MRSFSITTYSALRKKVHEILFLGQRKIEEAKVRTYWETGRLIKQHILGNADRADYGDQVIKRLSTDLDIDSSVLKRIRKFYEFFQKGAARHLSWAHCRALLTVEDEKQRLALADEAAKGEWTSRELEIEVRNLLWDKRVRGLARFPKEKVPDPFLKPPILGSFFTYKVLKPETEEGRLLIDLGFSCYRHLDAVTSKAFRPDDAVRSFKVADDRYQLSIFSHTRGVKGVEGQEDGLYTYKAKIEKIVDGDTLRVVVDLGFDTTTRQYIRLKGIDCPEMDTPEGRSAKRFVENTLRGLEFVTVKTVRSDKYDRYLGDVFYSDKAGKQVYLNNLLLEKGYAVRVRYC